MEMVATMFSWLLTPTVIFCVLNLVIGTIFITSRLKVNNKTDQHHQYSGHDMAVNNSAPDRHLVRGNSLLDRVRSFNFSSFCSNQPDPSLHSATQYDHDDPRDEQEQRAEEMTADVRGDEKVVMARSKSETSYAEAPVSRMKKSASEKAVVAKEEEVIVDRRQQGAMTERRGRWSRTTAPFGEDEAVDERADDFINRFRQQLKLQRLDSLLRYEEMLNRGAGR